MRSFVLIISILLVLSVLTACSPEFNRAKTASPSQPILTGDLGPEYIANSCAFQFDDGRADFVELPTSDIRVSHFGKALDYSRLNSLSDLSARATVNFMKLDGVDVYPVPINGNSGCRMFSALPSPPATLLQLWGALGLESLIGWFLPANRVSHLGFTRPVIMLRADTDRYTLIHEYLHFVYHEVRERDGYSDARLTQDMRDRSRRLQSMRPVKLQDDVARIKPYLAAWFDLVETYLEFSQNFPLEEISIEATLSEVAARGQLDHVTEYDRVNSVQYLRANYEKAQASLTSLTNEGRRLAPLIQKNKLSAEAKRMKELMGRAEDHLREARELLGTFAKPAFLAATPVALTEDSARAVRAHVNCSHGHWAEELAREGVIWPWASF